MKFATSAKTVPTPMRSNTTASVGSVEKNYAPERRSLEDMLELQGFPADFLEHSPFTMQAKRKLVGNGVPLAMGQAIARAVKKALEAELAA